jgi:hypothetical protein
VAPKVKGARLTVRSAQPRRRNPPTEMLQLKRPTSA